MKTWISSSLMLSERNKFFQEIKNIGIIKPAHVVMNMMKKTWQIYMVIIYATNILAK